MSDPANTSKIQADPERAYLALAAVLGHRTRGVGDLLREGVTVADLLQGAPEILARLPPAPATALLERGRQSTLRSVDRLQRALGACAARCLPIVDPRYPEILREIDDPPPWLFVRGSDAALNDLAAPTVAVVGSRRASHAGLALARDLASRLAATGYRVCSGLALGIDGAAHAGAMDRGCTVAVLGTGIDVIYPRRHGKLAGDIIATGALLSELPPGTAPHAGHFPRRNRIISGLSCATVIVEAALPSGSLHTAGAALEQGREVFVLPWSLQHRGGAGCLKLLRDGATPLTDFDELSDHFPTLNEAPGTRRTEAAAGEAPPGRRSEQGESPGKVEEPLLSLIGDTEVAVSELVRASAMALPELLSALGRLEAEGKVLRGDGGYSRAQCKSCAPRGTC